MMTFSVTTMTAGILGLLFFVLSWRVIRARQTLSRLENGEQILERRIRGHGNFSEYVPICLILLGLAEASGASLIVLWTGAATLILARVLHGYAFAFSDHSPIGRVGGTALTLISLISLAVINLLLAVGVL